ncbi:hypothetical protein FE634_12550 [Nocardioides dongxiaopingii]|uniref:hypothetical protein n=1 Tax=Nocardioides sp. S-1144 TaxID=2582905 RepID=UPI00110DC6A8|nr:hypothetical protein [Nocardioides sp. S-1144]QCW51025.1 hypothetical protein FE634_12550 [Nocardioides sp. S-1144]
MDPSATAERTGSLEPLVVQTAQLFSQAVTERTRLGYARRRRLFDAWCDAHDPPSLPSQPETVMLDLADKIGESGAALGTLRGWMAIVNRVHLEAGLIPPGKDPAMTTFLRGLSRAHPPSQRHEPMAALRMDDPRYVLRDVDTDPTTSRRARDRAI